MQLGNPVRIEYISPGQVSRKEDDTKSPENVPFVPDLYHSEKTSAQIAANKAGPKLEGDIPTPKVVTAAAGASLEQVSSNVFQRTEVLKTFAGETKKTESKPLDVTGVLQGWTRGLNLPGLASTDSGSSQSGTSDPNRTELDEADAETSEFRCPSTVQSIAVKTSAMGTHLLNPTPALSGNYAGVDSVSQLPSDPGEDIGLYSRIRCSTQFASLRISGASMSRLEINVPPVPAEVKIVAPWVSRAQELKDKEPIIAYYCLYHATQMGISAKSKEKDTKSFLMSLMTTLETMKDKLNDHPEINSDELAAKYIERFALKVFTNADNEDRKGESTRSTAKKFLAASNFFELLSIFDSKILSQEIKPADKIKYAKWKASDIAKAYREGRVPISGPATTMDFSEDELADKLTSSHSEAEDMSMGSSAGVTPQSAAKEHTPQSFHPVANRGATDAHADTPKPVNTTSPSKPSVISPTPKYISTVAHTSPYVVDLSSPTSSVDPTTPIKTPGLSEGLWSTAATPGIESPNMFSPFPGGSFGKAAASLMNPAAIAKFNALTGGSKVSPISPKARSGLSAMFIPPQDSKPQAQEKQAIDEDTDEEDGQWSTAGNDPFSRQNSMMPPSGPSVVVTSNLGVVPEEAPQSASLSSLKPQASHHLTTPGILAVPLPESASNTAPSSPHSRPDSLLPHVTFIKPASPRDELRVNPHFPIQPTALTPSAPPLDSSSTPRDQGHHVSSTATTGHGSLPTHLPHEYITSPGSAISPANTSSIHRGYTPPNSVISPHANFTNGTIPFTAPLYVPQPIGQYAPAGPAAHYAPPANGLGASRDEFGLGIPPRTPPAELDPEAIGKVQKHTKFALSALNFEDLDTAREELKKALRLLS
ncbi:hypothetical protein FRC17_002912 [Serendipita sp. 399]|nr:hypothetical protein FRC17_002912 [Serendipita sp. 399]